MELQRGIIERLSERVDAVGFAPIDRFRGAPKEHHPSRVCKDAKTVIVFGRTVPRGVFKSPDYNLHLLHRAYHTVYPVLDDIALDLAAWIEGEGNYLAVPVPSYAPLVFHGVEPWGLISLKHAAVAAGFMSFGRSGLAYHPHYGARLRLAAVITSARLEGTPLLEDMPCPEDCRNCIKACPVEAIHMDGFEKMKCLGHSIKHAIYPLALKSEEGIRHIERVINTAGHNYWLDCDECLKVCPLNERRR